MIATALILGGISIFYSICARIEDQLVKEENQQAKVFGGKNRQKQRVRVGAIGSPFRNG